MHTQPHRPRLMPIALTLWALFALGQLHARPAAPDPWAGMEQIVRSVVEPTFPDRDYVVTDFGAVGDGRSDARPAITEAVNKANAEGGGRIVLPAGTWLSNGPIHLKSGVNLYVSEGATLLFSEQPAHYLPVVRTRWEGTEAYNYSPLIYAYQAINVAVTGQGLIDGNSARGFGRWRKRQRAAQGRLRDMGGKGVPVHERVFGDGDFLRPSMVQFYACDNVLIEGVTVRDSPMWVNHLVYSYNVTVRGITVDSHRLNNDGVVVDSSSNVLVEHSSFNTGDDSIVIKSGRDRDAWRVGRPSENIVIRNNRMQGHNALAVGSEMSGGTRNIYMENNEVLKVRAAVYFKANLDRGGVVEKLRVRNIEVGEAEHLLRFQTDYHGYRGGSHPPTYRDFIIENVRARKVNTAIQATGVTSAPIQDVLVRNMVVDRAERPLRIAHVRNFVLENVRVNGKIVTLNEAD